MAQLIEMAENPNEETPNVNKKLKELADKIKQNPPEDKNDAHNKLMTDLVDVVYEAYHYEFHDFKNEKYAMPKAELQAKLSKIMSNVINGNYDN